MKNQLFVVLLCISSLSQADSVYCDSAAKNNYPALRNMTGFSTNLYHDAKMKLAHSLEYFCIKDGNSPEKDFESLLEGSTIAGQLFGLRGLSQTSPKRYHELKMDYAELHLFVVVRSTDILQDRRVSSLALSFGNSLTEQEVAQQSGERERKRLQLLDKYLKKEKLSVIESIGRNSRAQTRHLTELLRFNATPR